MKKKWKQLLKTADAVLQKNRQIFVTAGITASVQLAAAVVHVPLKDLGEARLLPFFILKNQGNKYFPGVSRSIK